MMYLQHIEELIGVCGVGVQGVVRVAGAEARGEQVGRVERGQRVQQRQRHQVRGAQRAARHRRPQHAARRARAQLRSVTEKIKYFQTHKDKRDILSPRLETDISTYSI